MDDDIINRMRREEAELVRKLEAVRGILRAYGSASDGVAVGDAIDAEVRKPSSQQTPKAKSRSREKMPIERFSPYGQLVVKAAIEECKDHIGRPISSRDMVDFVERRGVEVQGKDKANAISALLARSADLMPNGRKGWTLSDAYMERHDSELAVLFGSDAPKEKEPHSGSAGGSDAGEREVRTFPKPWEQPHSSRAS